MHLLNNIDVFYFYEDVCDMSKGFQIIHMTSNYTCDILLFKNDICETYRNI